MARQTTAEAVAAAVAQVRAEYEAQIALLTAKAAKTAKTPAEPKSCECGCGASTKGGRFVPGHDARLKGSLIAAARATKGESLEESAAAWERLVGLGWDHLFDFEDTEMMAIINRKKVAKKVG